MKRLRIVGALSVLLVSSSVLVGGVGGTAAEAAAAIPAVARPLPKAPPPPDAVDPARRDALLPRGWRTSDDVAWTTSGDSAGFHVLVADAASGYAWRTVASLAEPGFYVDQWIGNACLTASGRRLVVVYGPRTFTNRPDLFDRGGFTAVVDLHTGLVTKVPVQGSLAYFNPGCGTGERAVVTQFAGERADDPRGRAESRLTTVDAATGNASAPVPVGTEVFSAVPVGDAVVAASGGGLVRVGAGGRLHRLARAANVPLRLTADAGGGLVYVERAGERVRVRRTMPRPGAPVTTLAEGGLRDVTVTAGAGGRVFLTGRPQRVGALPAGVRRVDAPAGASVSSHGGVALTRVRWAGIKDPRAVPATDSPRDVIVEAKVLDTGAPLTFRVAPDSSGPRAAAGRVTHPKLAGGRRDGASRPGAPRVRGSVARAGSPTNPVEDERYCSVPRNDPRNQAMQPKPRQVEWAVDQAITKSLYVVRPANWKNLGMPSYSPQGLFPPLDLEGGGRIPAQVMLGIIAQESNMWQAPSFVLPGVTGNPLIGNYYGRQIYNGTDSDDWDIHWEDSDCGYGVAQITDGMRLAGRTKPNEVALPYDTQRAVALDFAANVAAGVRILQDKWNQTRRGGLYVHDGNPAALENWFFALWAYNTGFYPNPGNGQPWGVGWANNPINPRYDAQRRPFLHDTYQDARTPQRWPYPEKVLGWAGHPIELSESPDRLVHGYVPAWWPTDFGKERVKPPLDLFCQPSNDCYVGQTFEPNAPDVIGEPPGPCGHLNADGRYDLRCWYHDRAAWKSTTESPACSDCGNEQLRFDPGYPYQEDGTSFPPKCDREGLTDETLIIDDVPDGTPSIRPNCGRPWNNAGTLAFTFAADTYGDYPSKVDFHQVGGGFGGHMWRAYTRTAGTLGGKMKVTATWRLSQPRTGWHKIKISLPDHGAWTRQADYVINLGNGQTRHRVVNQAWRQHRWIDLGSFNLSGNASVTLTTVASDGTGDDSIVFDAVAFVPTGSPHANYVAMGDSFASGEGLQPYDTNSDYVRSTGNGEEKNACHRSQQGYPRLVTLPGHTKPIAQEAAEGTASFAFIACSGALTTSVTNDAVNNPPTADDRAGHTDWGRPNQHYGEVAQVDQGWLDVDTTHVTISIGGNDARFTDVMHGCLALRPLSGCGDEGYRLTRRSGVVDPAPLKTYEKNLLLEWLPRHLTAVYRAIHTKAPNAKIIVLGYPRMFPHETVPLGCAGISNMNMLFLNTLSAMMTIGMSHAVHDLRMDGVNITFVDPTPKWRIGVGAQEHWMCGAGAWLNGVMGPSSSGSGRDAIGVGTFHPNAAGQRAFADLVNSSLREPSPATAVRDRILAYTANVGTWSVTPEQAQRAADRCLDLTVHAGLVNDPCMTEPILLPTANGSKGAAENDNTALERNPQWVRLHYISKDNKKVALSRTWFDRAEYVQSACPKPPQPRGGHCDEYPFYTSEEGGSWDYWNGETSPASTTLRVIPPGENTSEGSQLGNMFTNCGMSSGAYHPNSFMLTANGQPYLTIPLLGEGHHRTFYVC
jgi:hypothetical protein